MKLIFIRHGDPDYSIDSLTQKGWKEVELLADRLEKLDVRTFYVSPLGRARDTANATLKRIGREAETRDWLQEFWGYRIIPETGRRHVAWDMLPRVWTESRYFYDCDDWYKDELLAGGHAAEVWEKTTAGIDELLAEYGYNREGRYYSVDEGCSNGDTLVFFCHLGISMAIMGHLLGISPEVLWHGFYMHPTAVTVFQSEEREKGKAYFRCRLMGCVEHLTNKGEPASEAGAFREYWKS